MLELARAQRTTIQCLIGPPYLDLTHRWRVIVLVVHPCLQRPGKVIN